MVSGVAKALDVSSGHTTTSSASRNIKVVGSATCRSVRSAGTDQRLPVGEIIFLNINTSEYRTLQPDAVSSLQGQFKSTNQHVGIRE